MIESGWNCTKCDQFIPDGMTIWAGMCKSCRFKNIPKFQKPKNSFMHKIRRFWRWFSEGY